VDKHNNDKEPDVHLFVDVPWEESPARIGNSKAKHYLEVSLWLNENLIREEYGYLDSDGFKHLLLSQSSKWNRGKPLIIPYDEWNNAIADAILLQKEHG
jgi:hypothetical protein